MSVLIPNTKATVSHRSEGEYNSHGERVAGGFEAPAVEPLDAFVKQRGDGGWTLSVDDALWPVREGDVIITADERVFVVRTADLLTNAFDSTVNHVRCEALRVESDGTQPQDSWFVGRD